jgi:disulfide bond formation protein DsbB
MENIIKFKENIWSWRILSLIPVFLILSALYFQHGMGLEPCVLCIYQRIGTIAIFIGALLPQIFGLKNQVSKFFAYVLWIAGSGYTLWAAALQWHETILAEKNPFFISQCGLGLEHIFPWILESDILTGLFVAKGICTEIDWEFLGLEMHHYMTLIAACFLVSGLFYATVSLVQKIKGK